MVRAPLVGHNRTGKDAMRQPSSKIKDLGQLAGILEGLRGRNKTIVLCHGVFDLLHPGHIKHFEAAREKGDVLVVTLTKDEYVNKGPGRPVFNERLRADSIAAIESVDYVAINEWPTAVETIKLLKPDVYVKGSDYADMQDDITGGIYAEEEALKQVGGVLHHTDEVTFSSSNLINAFLTPFADDTKEFLHGLASRYSIKDVAGALEAAESVKVLVIGDVIIDEYQYCAPIGKSAKDNIIATSFRGDERFAGGVLAAANHIAGFCRDVTLVTCRGTENDYADFVAEHLKPNIQARFFEWPGAPTVVKTKFVQPENMSKLFEVQRLPDSYRLDPKAERALCAYLEKALPTFDMVLVADFGHGLLTPKVVKTLAAHSPFLAVNVQTNSSNIGFNLITKFPRADFVCIDEPEIRLACHDRHSNLEKLVKIISGKLSCDRVIVTRGHRGSLAYSSKDGFIDVPVFSREVLDTIGAGDAYFSITSPLAYQGAPIDLVGFIGNAVGAMSVLVVGNRSSIERVPLLKYAGTLLK
jgi:rfaE bifunctional protein nucleotidyltransferase chain/domain